MTAQGPCHHPSTRRGVTGENGAGAGEDEVTRRRVALWVKVSTDGTDGMSLSVCTCLLQNTNLGLGSAQQPRIDPRRTGRHRRGETQTHSRSTSHVRRRQDEDAMQLGQGLDLELDLQKQSGRERGCSGDKASMKGPGKENPQSQKPGRALVAMSCRDFFILSEKRSSIGV